jgi:hypothetical protein
MIGLLLLTAFLAEVQTDVSISFPILPFCQEGTVSGEDSEEKKEKVEKAPPIPPLSALERDKLKRFLKFMKTSNLKKRRGYEDKLIAIGRGAIPSLLEKAETTHVHLAPAVDRCLLVLLDVRDAKILGDFSRSKTVRLRRIAIAKYAGAARPGDKEIIKGFLKDTDAAIRLEAALGLVKMKDPAGIPEIIVASAGASGREKKRILADVALLKGKIYSSHFRSLATKHKDPKVRKAALELIVAIGDKRVKDVLGLALRDDHNLVKTAAVNALRQLIKGEKPTTFETVFALVDAVEKWQKELGLAR